MPKFVAEEDDIVIRPQDGGQVQFLWAPEFEVLGGGSAGGGKSWCLVYDALGTEYESDPAIGKPAFMTQGYRAILFRRESTQLDRLISEAKRYYPALGGKFVGGRTGEPGPCFEWPEYDSKIFFCHMQLEDNKETHQGQEYQFVGFDELTHFTITQYLYLFTRLRTSTKGIRPRVRSTTNPTGPGLWWVRKRFVDNWPPNTRKFFIADEDPEKNPRGIEVPRGTKGALSRRFVPLWLAENKVLEEADPLYADRIRALGQQMERALLEGNWYAFGGDFFSGFDRGRQIVTPFSIPKEWELIGSIDPGFSSPCSFGLTAADFEGNYYRIATYYKDRMSAPMHAEAIKKFIANCPYTAGRMPSRIVSGTDAFAKKDQFAVIASTKTFAEQFEEAGLYLERATTDRYQGWWNWKGLFGSAKTPPRWFVFKDSNEPLLDEMSAAVFDAKDLEDIKGKGNDPEIKDHALDECRYGLMAIAKSVDVSKKHMSAMDQFLAGTLNKRGTGKKKQWRPGMG